MKKDASILPHFDFFSFILFLKIGACQFFFVVLKKKSRNDAFPLFIFLSGTPIKNASVICPVIWCAMQGGQRKTQAH
jgi:hypothetical protein